MKSEILNFYKIARQQMCLIYNTKYIIQNSKRSLLTLCLCLKQHINLNFLTRHTGFSGNNIFRSPLWAITLTDFSTDLIRHKPSENQND